MSNEERLARQILESLGSGQSVNLSNGQVTIKSGAQSFDLGRPGSVQRGGRLERDRRAQGGGEEEVLPLISAKALVQGFESGNPAALRQFWVCGHGFEPKPVSFPAPESGDFFTTEGQYAVQFQSLGPNPADYVVMGAVRTGSGVNEQGQFNPVAWTVYIFGEGAIPTQEIIYTQQTSFIVGEFAVVRVTTGEELRRLNPWGFYSTNVFTGTSTVPGNSTAYLLGVAGASRPYDGTTQGQRFYSPSTFAPDNFLSTYFERNFTYVRGQVAGGFPDSIIRVATQEQKPIEADSAEFGSVPATWVGENYWTWTQQGFSHNTNTGVLKAGQINQFQLIEGDSSWTARLKAAAQIRDIIVPQDANTQVVKISAYP